MDEKLKYLYEVLRKEELTTKSFEDFSKEYSGNAEKIQYLHNVLKEEEITTKDFDTFKNEYFGESTQPQPETTQDNNMLRINQDKQQEEKAMSLSNMTEQEQAAINQPQAETQKPQVMGGGSGYNETTPKQEPIAIETGNFATMNENGEQTGVEQSSQKVANPETIVRNEDYLKTFLQWQKDNKVAQETEKLQNLQTKYGKKTSNDYLKDLQGLQKELEDEGTQKTVQFLGQYDQIYNQYNTEKQKILSTQDTDAQKQTALSLLNQSELGQVYQQAQQQVDTIEPEMLVKAQSYKEKFGQYQELADLTEQTNEQEKKVKQIVEKAKFSALAKVTGKPEWALQIEHSFTKSLINAYADVVQNVGIASKLLSEKTDKLTGLITGEPNYVSYQNIVPLEKQFEYEVGQKIKDFTEETFAEHPEMKNTFWLGTIPQGAGFLASMAGGGAVTPTLKGIAGKALTAKIGSKFAEGTLRREVVSQLGNTSMGALALGSSAAGVQEYQAALAQTNGDTEKAYKAWIAGNFIGSLDAFAFDAGGNIAKGIGSKILNSQKVQSLAFVEKMKVAGVFDKLNKLSNNTVANALAQGNAEAVEEGISQILTNKSAKEIYDNSRELFDGLGESMAAGFVLGGLMGSFQGQLQSRIKEEKDPKEKAILQATAKRMSNLQARMKFSETKAAKEKMTAKNTTATNTTPEENTQVENPAEVTQPEGETVEVGETVEWTVPKNPKIAEIENKITEIETDLADENLDFDISSDLEQKRQELLDEKKGLETQQRKVEQVVETKDALQESQDKYATIAADETKSATTREIAAKKAADTQAELDTLQESPEYQQYLELSELEKDLADAELETKETKTNTTENPVAAARGKILGNKITSKLSKPLGEAIDAINEVSGEEKETLLTNLINTTKEVTDKSQKSVMKTFDDQEVEKQKDVVNGFVDMLNKPKTKTQITGVADTIAEKFDSRFELQQDDKGKWQATFDGGVLQGKPKETEIKLTPKDVTDTWLDIPLEDSNYIERVANESTNPTEIESAIEIEKTKIADDRQAAMAEKLKNVRVKTTSFNEVKSSAAQKGSIIAANYLSANGQSLDSIAAYLTSEYFNRIGNFDKDNEGKEFTEEEIADFIIENQTGAGSFLKNRKANLEKLSKRLKQLKGKKTTPKTDAELAELQKQYEQRQEVEKQYFEGLKTEEQADFESMVAKLETTQPNIFNENAIDFATLTDFLNGEDSKAIAESLGLTEEKLITAQELSQEEYETQQEVFAALEEFKQNPKQDGNTTEKQPSTESSSTRNVSEKGTGKTRTEKPKVKNETTTEKTNEPKTDNSKSEGKVETELTEDKNIKFAQIGIAPERSNTIDKFDDAEEGFKSKAYIEFYSKTLPNIAAAVGIKIGETVKTVGGYFLQDTQQAIKEPSVNILFGNKDATEQQLEDFAVLAAVLSPDVQESVMKIMFAENGKDTLYRFFVPNNQAAEIIVTALNENGIVAYSYDPKGKVLYVADTNNEKFETLETLITNETERGNIERFEHDNANIDFINEGRYGQKISSIGRKKYDQAVDSKGQYANLESLRRRAEQRLADHLKTKLIAAQAEASKKASAKKSTPKPTTISYNGVEYTVTQKTDDSIEVAKKVKGKLTPIRTDSPNYKPVLDLFNGKQPKANPEQVTEETTTFAKEKTQNTMANQENSTNLAENTQNDKDNGTKQELLGTELNKQLAGKSQGILQGTENDQSAKNIRGKQNEQGLRTDDQLNETELSLRPSEGDDLGGVYANRVESNEELNEKLGGESIENQVKETEEGNGVLQPLEDNGNLVIPNDFTHSNTFNPKIKFEENIAALKLLLTLKQENRKATAEEQQVLFKFVSFGGLKDILFDPYKDWNWKAKPSENEETEVNISESDVESSVKYGGGYGDGNPKYRELVKQVYDLIGELDPDGNLNLLNEMKKSTLSSYFTPIPVIRGIYKVLENFGFKGGRVLEPSAGTGHFFGAMPYLMAKVSKLFGVEIQKVTADIAKNLYPSSNFQNTGLQSANLPKGYFDLVISNIPFGDTRVHDESFAKSPRTALKLAQSKIHNYFFAKALELVRPNGIVAFVTSKGVLDSKGNEFLREHIGKEAEFLGAIRLPNTTFVGNAGTAVVTDIIFLRKFGNGEKATQSKAFTKSVPVTITDKNGNKTTVNINEYFANNPEQAIGEMQAGGMYGANSNDYTLVADKSIDLEQKIAELGKTMKDKFYKEQGKEDAPKSIYEVKDYDSKGQYVRNGNLVLDSDGNIATFVTRGAEKGLNAEEKQVADNNIITRYSAAIINEETNKDATPKQKEVIKDYIAVRNLVNQIFDNELSGNVSEDTLQDLRKDLEKTYNEFVRKHGRLTDNKNYKAFSQDIDAYNMLALEIYDKDTKQFKGTSDIFRKRTLRPITRPEKANTPQEAIAISLGEYGVIYPDRIAELLDKSWKEARKDLKDIVYELPTGGYETSDRYLSGNVKKKLAEAKAAADIDERFAENVTALENVQPKDIPHTDIYVQMGANWISPTIIEDFVKELLGDKFAKILYVSSADKWNLTLGNSPKAQQYRVLNPKTDAGRSTVELFLDAIKGVYPRLTYKEIGDTNPTFDPVATAQAKVIIDKIRNQFRAWLFSNEGRRAELQKKYNDTFNAIVRRKYNGSHLNLIGYVGHTPRQHQLDAAWMVLQNVGGMIDHIVGAGKTLVMVIAAMEMKRLGIAKKPMLVCKKANVGQIAQAFRESYPTSKVLAPSEADFNKENRKKLLAQIANNDWDAIVISHEQLKYIESDPDTEIETIREEIDEIDLNIEALSQMEQNQMSKKAKQGLEKRKENLLAKIQGRLAMTNKDSELRHFGQLGIDHAFIDESHEFKNLQYSSMYASRGIAGLGSPAGNQKTLDLVMKVRYLQKLNKGDKGVTFLSGTPLSNSLVEMFLVFKYLRPETLKEMGLNSFDLWAKIFAEPTMGIDFTVTSEVKEKIRMREFQNVPELLNLYNEITDLRNDNNLELPKPTMKGGGMQLIKVKPSEVGVRYAKALIQFSKATSKEGMAQAFRDFEFVPPREFSESDYKGKMLLATTLSAKMAMDMRLLNPTLPDSENSKISASAKKVAEIYHRTHEHKGTQLVFSDIGVPKTGNIVEDLEEVLANGYEIGNEQREVIFAKANGKTPTFAVVKQRIEKMQGNGELDIDLDKAIAEAKEEGFNIYQALKTKLVKQYGVPVNEIAFIHDYNGTKQRQKLYDDVNSGKIRIVIGSTGKMGVGVNMQKRIVGMHHLDAPWTYEKIEQRNGRGIRQGNEVARDFYDNEVEVYVYGTENTLDSLKFDLGGKKLSFMNQRDSFKGRILSEGDISDDGVATMAAFVSELSGDKSILEKAKVEGKLQSLDNERRGAMAAVESAKSKLNFNTGLNESTQQSIDDYTKDSDKFSKHIKDNDLLDKTKNEIIFEVEINGEVFTDKVNKETKEEKADKTEKDKSARVRAGEVLNQYLAYESLLGKLTAEEKTKVKQAMATKQKFSKVIGNAYSFPISIVVENNSENLPTVKLNYLQTASTNPYTIRVDKDKDGWRNAAELLNTLRGISQDKKNNQDRLTQRNAENEVLQAEINKTWNKQQEYDQTIAKQQAIQYKVDSKVSTPKAIQKISKDTDMSNFILPFPKTDGSTSENNFIETFETTDGSILMSVGKNSYDFKTQKEAVAKANEIIGYFNDALTDLYGEKTESKEVEKEKSILDKAIEKIDETIEATKNNKNLNAFVLPIPYVKPITIGVLQLIKAGLMAGKKLAELGEDIKTYLENRQEYKDGLYTDKQIADSVEYATNYAKPFIDKATEKALKEKANSKQTENTTEEGKEEKTNDNNSQAENTAEETTTEETDPEDDNTPPTGGGSGGVPPSRMRERGLAKEIRTNLAAGDILNKTFDDNKVYYEQLSNSQTLAEAQADIDTAMADDTGLKMATLIDKANQNEEGYSGTAKQNAIGMMLGKIFETLSKQTKDADKAKEYYNLAKEILVNTAERMTVGGQAGQIRAAFTKIFANNPEIIEFALAKAYKAAREDTVGKQKQNAAKFEAENLTNSLREDFKKEMEVLVNTFAKIRKADEQGFENKLAENDRNWKEKFEKHIADVANGTKAAFKETKAKLTDKAKNLVKDNKIFKAENIGNSVNAIKNLSKMGFFANPFLGIPFSIAYELVMFSGTVIEGLIRQGSKKYFNDFSEAVVEQYGENINPFLTDMYNAAIDEMGRRKVAGIEKVAKKSEKSLNDFVIDLMAKEPKKIQEIAKELQVEYSISSDAATNLAGSILKTIQKLKDRAKKTATKNDKKLLFNHNALNDIATKIITKWATANQMQEELKEKNKGLTADEIITNEVANSAEFAALYGLPPATVSDKMRATIQRYSEEIKDLPEGEVRNQKIEEFTKELTKEYPTKLSDYFHGFFFPAVLGGVSTQFVNVWDNAWVLFNNAIAQFTQELGKIPKGQHRNIPIAIEAMLRGVADSQADIRSILAYGENAGNRFTGLDNDISTSFFNNTEEGKYRKRGVEELSREAPKWIRWLYVIGRSVSRLMSAADMIFSNANRDMHLSLLTVQTMRTDKNLKGADLREAVMKAMFGDGKQLTDAARKQAIREAFITDIKEEAKKQGKTETEIALEFEKRYLPQIESHTSFVANSNIGSSFVKGANKNEEGKKLLFAKRRAKEIILQQGNTKENLEEAKEYGMFATLKNTPTGPVGLIVNVLNQALGSIPYIGTAFRVLGGINFLNTMGNILNRNLNWTPLGLARVYRGYKHSLGLPTFLSNDRIIAEMEKKGIKSSSLGKQGSRIREQQLMQASLGTMSLFVAALAWALKDDDDDEETGFDITGTGMGDFKEKASKNERHALKSVHYNGIPIPYQNAPMVAMAFSVVGNYADYVKKYGNKDDDATARLYLSMNAMFWGTALGTAYQVGVEGTPLRSLSQALKDDTKRYEGEEGLAVAKNQLFRNSTGFVMPNFFKSIARINDPNVYKTGDMKGAVLQQLGMIQMGNLAADMTGNDSYRVDIETAMPIYDVFGRPVQTFQTEAFIPTIKHWLGKAKNSAVDKLVYDKLEMEIVNLGANTQIIVNGKKAQVGDKNAWYQFYVQKAGKLFYKRIDQSYKQIDETQKTNKEAAIKLIESLRAAANAQAKTELMNKIAAKQL